MIDFPIGIDLAVVIHTPPIFTIDLGARAIVGALIVVKKPALLVAQDFPSKAVGVEARRPIALTEAIPARYFE